MRDLLAALMFALVACVPTATAVRQLRIGMTPDQVIERLGEPKLVFAPKALENGSIEQVYGFEIARIDGQSYGDSWAFHFVNNRLVTWEPAPESADRPARPAMDDGDPRRARRAERETAKAESAVAARQLGESMTRTAEAQAGNDSEQREARQCSSRCASDAARCRSQCFNDWTCESACRDSERHCKFGCE